MPEHLHNYLISTSGIKESAGQEEAAEAVAEARLELSALSQLGEKAEERPGQEQDSWLASAFARAGVSISPALLFLVSAAFFMEMLDGTILNTSLPAIAHSLGESPLRMQAVLIAYLLTVAIFIPCSGWLADRFGTRRVFSLALVLFCSGSILCAFSKSLQVMVLARILQGMGGAIMAPIGRLVILKVVPRSELMRVLSIITLPSLLGPLLGPVLGGLISEHLNWSWIFLINVPVGIAGLWIAHRQMPDLKAVDAGKFDYTGFVLFALAMVSVSLAVEGISQLPISRAAASILMLFGVICLLLYVWHALYTRKALLGLKPFRTRGFSVGIAGNFFGRLGSGAVPFLIPLTLQVGLGYSPSKSGLTMIPLALGAISIRLILSRLIKFMGLRRILVSNTIVLGLVISSFASIGLYTEYWLLLLHLMLFGIINSTQFVSMNTATLIDLPPEDTSSGNSILTVSMQLSVSMGVSCGAMVLGLFAGTVITAPEVASPALLPAFRYTFIIIGASTLLVSIIFRLLPAGIGAGSK